MSDILPVGWCAARLAEVAILQLGKMLSAKAKTGRGARPYLRNVNVRWHRIDVEDVLEMDFDAREVEKYRLQAGDVLVCEGGEPGRAAVWSNQLPGALYQKALHRVRFMGECVDPRYFTYFLELAAVEGLLAKRFTGSTIKHLPREAFLEVRIPVAPLAEQRRIVAALEEHLSELDAAVAGLERARANCANLRAAVLKATVDGSLIEGLRHRGVAAGPDSWSPSVPADWSWRTVEELADLVEYGTSAKTGDDEHGVPVLRMGNIVDGALSWESLKFLPRAHAEFPRLLLRDGDLLFNRTNSPELVGKSAVFRDRGRKASFASYLLRVRLREDMSPEFLAAYLNSRYGRAWVANVVSQQVGQANVNGSKLRALHVPVPPRETQSALVHALTRTIDGLDQTTTEVGRQLLRATRLRQSILKHAFEGKLVPQDPNDEPASVLLDRIRAEREPAAPRAPKSRPKAKTPRKPPHR